MAQVLVSNLDDGVLTSLRHKAELHGHSLEQELRLVLTAAAQLTGNDRLAFVRSVRAQTPAGVPQTDSAALIRQDRDTR